MITLHKTIEEIWFIAKWGAIGIITIILLIIFTGLGKKIIEIIAPTPPPPPTVGFDKLPSLFFPRSSIKQEFTYSLNTLTGALPTFEDRAKVYRIEKPSVNLLALERAKDTVSNIGFDLPENALSSTTSEWNEDEPPFRKLTMNIFSLDFFLTSAFINDPDVLRRKYLPLNEKEVIKEAKSFFSYLDSLPKELDDEKTKKTLFLIENDEVVQTTSLSNAHVIRVDLFPKDIDNFPLYFPHPPRSLIYALVGSGYNEPQIVEAAYFYRKQTGSPETYPIKTAEKAFKQLENGDAYIASYEGSESEISIKNVFLAYYLSGQEQDYFMPIVVFEGDDRFLAYVSAITDEWVETK